MKLAREGYPLIAFTVFMIIGSVFFAPPVPLFLLPVLGLVVWFFRDPERFPDDSEEMLAAGMVPVYLPTTDKRELRSPDPADDDFARAMRASSMRWSIAGLVIAFPVFVLVARVLGRELERSPVRRLSAVRRWLTYLTLFLAATVLICDMIVLVYNLLGGGLSARFLLKVLVVAVIAGTVFGWYLQDLRREERQPAAGGMSGKLVLGAAAVVILATLVASVAVIRSPAAEREARLDTRREQDLARIARLVEAHYQRTGELPASLDELATPGTGLPLDPVHGVAYRYEATGERTYRLCARFGTDTAQDGRQPFGGDAWLHGAGEHCFERRADPGR